MNMLFLKSRVVLLFIFHVFFVFGQEPQKTITIKEGKTVDILKKVEIVFGVYYSYSDSLLHDKYLILKKDKFTLSEFHLFISNENDLNVVHIGDNMYALSEKNNIYGTLLLTEIIVNGYLLNTIIKDSRKTTLQSFNNEVLPGISDFDVLRAFQHLPGVKSPNQTSSGLYIKGGMPDQNLLLWNKIKIYHPGHFFGMISPVNPQMVDEAVLYSTIIPIEFNARASSVVDLTSKSLSTGNESFQFGIDMLHADILQREMFHNKKVGLKYSIRKSLAPLLVTPTYESYTQKVFQNSSISLNDKQNNFDFWDGSVALDYTISDKTNMTISSIYINNNLDFTNRSLQSENLSQKMEIENYGSSIQISSNLNEKSLFRSTLQFSQYNFDYQRDIRGSSRSDIFLKHNDIFDLTADLFFKYRISEYTNYLFGYQLSSYSIDHRMSNNNDNFGFTLSERKGNIISNSINFMTNIKKDRFEIQAGSLFTSNNMKPFLIEPRLNFSYNISEYLQYLISFERRSQLLQQVNENAAGDISLENYIWVLSDNDVIPVLFTNHFSMGLLYKKNKFAFDVDIYFKKTNGITSFSQGVVFSSTDFSDGLVSLTNGFNLSNGIDISFQKEISRFKFWTTYSFLNSKNKIGGVNNGYYFSSNSNITHSANITARYQFSSFFISLGWLWNSGRPYSALDQNNSLISINDKKLSDFHSLDFSLLYTIVNKEKYNLKAGISINNLYNHKVIINKEISRLYETANDLVNARYKISDYYSLGFTPNIFLKFSF